MNPKVRMFFARTVLEGMKLLYAVVLVLTCAFSAIWISSPFVLTFLVVLNKLNKPLALLNGDILYLWLTVSAVIFVPLLIYSIIYRIIQKEKTKKALAQAREKAEQENKVKEKK